MNHAVSRLLNELLECWREWDALAATLHNPAFDDWSVGELTPPAELAQREQEIVAALSEVTSETEWDQLLDLMARRQAQRGERLAEADRRWAKAQREKERREDEQRAPWDALRARRDDERARRKKRVARRAHPARPRQGPTGPDWRLDEIGRLLRKWAHGECALEEPLCKRRIAHVTYSSVRAVESCAMYYYLKYVEQAIHEVEPKYLIKGRLLHAAARTLYTQLRDGAAVDERAVRAAARGLRDSESRTHLANAISLMIENTPAGWEVVSVAQPFVLLVHPDVPPWVGIIDVVLRRGDDFMVVEHKSTRAFDEPDSLELAISREHVLRSFSPRAVRTAFHQYRWVDDLRRIRKPAFRVIELELSGRNWREAVHRCKRAARTMQAIDEPFDVRRDEKCWGCEAESACSPWWVSDSEAMWAPRQHGK